MNVGDPFGFEAGAKDRLGETCTSGRRNRANIDQRFHAGGLEPLDDVSQSGGFVADGEDGAAHESSIHTGA
jgi:hypothetical protein